MFTPFPTSSPFRVSVPPTPCADLCCRASMGSSGGSSFPPPAAACYEFTILTGRAPSLGTWCCWGQSCPSLHSLSSPLLCVGSCCGANSDFCPSPHKVSLATPAVCHLMAMCQAPPRSRQTTTLSQRA